MHRITSPTFFSSLILTFLLFFSPGISQTKPNLDIFYSMVDSSAVKLLKSIPPGGNRISLEFNSGNNYLALENRLIKDLTGKGLQISGQENKDDVSIRFIIDHVELKYGDIYRSGFLGSYYIPRIMKLSGNFTVDKPDISESKFSYAYNDTVEYDSLKSTENPAFPFTQGEIPSEPFFSSLLEPVVAVGAAAAAVILFFTVRSK